MPRRKAPGSPYSGVLATRLPPEPDLDLRDGPRADRTYLDGLTDEERRKSFRERHLAAQLRRDRDLIERAGALFKHFGIDPQSASADTLLWLALAKRHVPGFSEATASKRGRHRKWTFSEEAELFFAVLRETKNGKSENAACLEVARQEIEKKYPKASQTEKRKLREKLKSTIHRRWVSLKQNPIFKIALQQGDKTQESLRALHHSLSKETK